MKNQPHPMTKARELALHTLFQFEFSRDKPVHDSIAYLAKELKLPIPPQRFAEELVTGVLDQQKNIDSLISSTSAHWKLSRMALVDVSLLRLATYEMLYFQKTPPNVVINEYIELAKKYSSEDSPSFINALLDKIKENPIE